MKTLPLLTTALSLLLSGSALALTVTTYDCGDVEIFKERMAKADTQPQFSVAAITLRLLLTVDECDLATVSQNENTFTIKYNSGSVASDEVMLSDSGDAVFWERTLANGSRRTREFESAR